MTLLGADAPECSINFDRNFSLPFGVPPELTSAGLASYFDGLDLYLGFVQYAWNATDTMYSDLNPRFASAARARTLPIAAGGGEVVLPTSTTLVPGLQAKTAVGGLAGVADLDNASFRRDPDTKDVSALPMPMVTDESLALHWSSAPASGPLLAAALPGILASDSARHLLGASAAARDGELERALLRAPATGLVRFERYRHIKRAAGGKLEEMHPSSAGALVIKQIPQNPTMIEPDSVLFKQRLLVFENVDIATAEECFVSLALVQLVSFRVLKDKKTLVAAVTEQGGWLFRSWLAFLRLMPPADDPLGGLSGALLTPFRSKKTQTADEIQTLADAALASGDARAGLLDFIRSYYVRMICGRSWSELGVALPAEAGLDAEGKKARQTLVNLPKAPGTWLACYAGCPLGKPSKIYVDAPGAAPTAPNLVFGGLTTFELEAVIIAGENAAQFPGIAAAALPASSQPLNLTAFDVQADGLFAIFRTQNKVARKQEFTTLDWLSELVMGANRGMVEFGAAVDFAQFATHAHPLADALGWTRFGDAVHARSSLDTLQSTTVAGGLTLEAALVDWWGARSGMSVAGKWPFGIPLVGIDEVRIGPRDPYLAGDTPKPPNNLAGFDVFDIAATLQARTLVADGKDPTHDVDLAVMLALMDREGYRAGARESRMGSHPSGKEVWIDLRWGLVDTDIGGDPHFDGAARLHWIVFPFGLDLVNEGVAFSPNLLRDSRAAFVTFTERLQAAGVFSAGWDARSAHAFAINRLQGRAHGPAKIVQERRTSRRIQWLGIAIQQAEFQRRHNILCYGTGGRKLNRHWILGDHGVVPEEVDELADLALPPIGASADSLERRDFIAYYALLYLAYNIHPDTWNQWVRAAKANMGAGGKVSRYLTYYSNAVARDVEPMPPAVGDRYLFQRANMLRFAIALDAYLRMSLDPDELTNPDAGRAAW